MTANDTTSSLAVCLTGELRWPELTLATLQHQLLDRMHGQRVYYVGPADSSYQRATSVLSSQLHMQDACAYHPSPTWVWSNATSNLNDSASFELHGRDLCTRPDYQHALPPRLVFNAAWLPFFRRCKGRFAQRFPASDHPPDGYPDAWNRGRLRRAGRSWVRMLCTSAVSLVMQLWQSSQCVNLLKAAEHRSWSSESGSSSAEGLKPALHHHAVLRLRADLFFFTPVQLPELLGSSPTVPRFSLLEDTCTIERGLVEMRRKARAQFFQDFWVLSNRAAMVAVLQTPLQRLLLLGRESTLALAGHDGSPSEFGVNPVVSGISSRLNSSHCVRHSGNSQQLVGLMRVNVLAGCFMVQTRVGKLTLSGWTEVDLATGSVSAQCGGILRNFTWGCTEQMRINFKARLPGFDRSWLRRLADVYGTCFGLKSNASCPRMTGDKLLHSGKMDECFRTTPALRRSNAAAEHASGKSSTDGRCDVTRQLETRHAANDLPQDGDRASRMTSAGFACVEAGLRRGGNTK